MNKILSLIGALMILSCGAEGFQVENNSSLSEETVMSIKSQLDSLAILNLGTSTNYISTKIQLEPSFGTGKDLGWKSNGAFYYSQGPLDYLQTFATDKDDKVILTGEPVDAGFFN